MPPDPTHDITHYAEILAHVRHYADKHAEVIARLGVRRRDWDAASAKWRKVRDAERMSGDLDATVRFGRVLADVRATLAARKPPIEALGPLPGPDGDLDLAAKPHAPRPTAEQPPVSAAPPPESPALQVPSFLAPTSHTPEPLPLPVSPPPALSFTMPLGAALPIAPTTPFIVSAGSSAEALDRAVAHADAVQGPVSARPAIGTGTVGIGSESPAPATPPGVPELTLQQYASLRVELHQQPEQAAAILGRYGVAPEARAALEAHWRARFDGDPALRNAFAGAYASYVAWLGREHAAAPPSLPPVVRPPAQMAATVEADFSALVAAGRGALPFAGAPGEVDLARYPLELYAAVAFALARGEAREQVLAHHGLTAARFEEVAHAWSARFTREPELLTRFQALARGGSGRSA